VAIYELVNLSGDNRVGDYPTEHEALREKRISVPGWM
jgi:hypothetical protein